MKFYIIKFFLFFMLSFTMLVPQKVGIEKGRMSELLSIPELTGRVVDLTNTLTHYEKEVIERKLEQLEKSKGSQVVVLIVSTTGEESIEEYSMRVVEKWKIGRKGIDDGVLLLIAKRDRRLRIEVGYGLEGAIPDAKAKRIIEDIIVPEFKERNFYEGISKGVDAIINLINGEDLPVSETKKMNKYSLMIFIGIFLFALTMIFMGRPLMVMLISTVIFSILGFTLIDWSIALLAIILIVVFALSAFGNSSPSKNGRYAIDRGRFWSSRGFSGGGFSGGGGSFGGGGASGSW